MRKLVLIEALLAISLSLMAGGPAKTYKNPVVNYSLPDPSVIKGICGPPISIRSAINMCFIIQCPVGVVNGLAGSV